MGIKIGLMYGWQINSLVPLPKGHDRNFLGDEMTGLSLRRELLKYDDIDECELYCDEHDKGMPEGTDICIDMNPHCKGREKAKVQLLYFQNAPGEGSDRLWDVMKGFYDGVAFSAVKVWEKYGSSFVSRSGHKGIFLPLAADEELFYPSAEKEGMDYDIVYCGNDIKRHRTPMFFEPALRYKFGLFGRWTEENRVYDKFSKGQVNFGDLRELYTQSKICINIHFQDALDNGLWAGRIFDVLACNGVLVSDTPYGLSNEIRSMGIFLSEGQLRDRRFMVDLYGEIISNPSKYARKGREFVLGGHTWAHRAKQLHDYIQEFK